MQSPESTLEALTTRVAKLEAQNRRLKNAGIGALLVAAAVAVISMRQTEPNHVFVAEIIRAHSISADMIDLTSPDAGTALMPGAVELMTKDTTVAIKATSEEGPSLRMMDREGFQATLGVSSLETTKTGKGSKTSAASVILSGKQGNVLWSAP